MKFIALLVDFNIEIQSSRNRIFISFYQGHFKAKAVWIDKAKVMSFEFPYSLWHFKKSFLKNNSVNLRDSDYNLFFSQIKNDTVYCLNDVQEIYIKLHYVRFFLSFLNIKSNTIYTTIILLFLHPFHFDAEKLFQ